ncbi:MAG: methylenetetrahydrofolate reductase [NAD(P)H] [Wenzhouxiangellaceae bacterium]
MDSLTPTFSFEVFPPKDEAQQLVLESTLEKLVALHPAYISVTFGAGGSTLDRTRDTVMEILNRYHVSSVPHLSCMASQEVIDQLLETYRQAGVKRLVVLRGDQPPGVEQVGPFRYASDLVAHIRERFGDAFHIEVACYPEFHPESENPESELKYFRQKVLAGADGAITQYFFNAEAYFRMVEDSQRMGLDLPIVPGIMPITNYERLARFSNLCGAEIPQWIRRRLQGYGDDGASVRAFGEEVVTRLCQQLLDGGAPGLHFYTLNRANATLRIWRNLGLRNKATARARETVT